MLRLTGSKNKKGENRMKRLFALLLAGLLTLSMAACGNEPSGTQAVSASAASSTANTPEPAPSAAVDAGETAEQAAAASDDPYAALETELEAQPMESAEAAAEDGIRPEFKAAMDSYEAFFDEYVAFMKEYAESTDAAGMSTEYLTMMQQYLETMEAMQELGEEELSDQEAVYYAEVSLRISQKLMEVA